MNDSISFSDVSFRYGRHDVFRNFNLEFEPGNIYGLLGANGAGKSTLLHLACGLLFAQGGAVTFSGMDMKKRLPEALCDIYLVPEEFNLPNMTLEKYVRIHAPFYPRYSEETLVASLDAFGMTRDLHLNQLSMGQKKKAFVCFALATNTRLLLMDEPTNGLDIPSKSQFRKAVAQSMADDRVIVISTHQVRDVENLLDRVLVLNESELLLNASVMKLAQRLAFVQNPTPEQIASAIHIQSSGFGTSAVIRNDNPDTESVINMEMLFNATLANPQAMTNIINN